jgi:protein-L-isoaspartate O-methyltransferase
VEDDAAFAAFSRAARADALAPRLREAESAGEDAQPADDPLVRALHEVPRERFVPLLALPEAHLDRALLLDDGGQATVSAMHAYLAQFRALELGEGDALVDLGGGSGYGAAIAAAVVGPLGEVTCVEIDPALAARAAAALGKLSGGARVRVVTVDAHDADAWAGARKVSVGFDVGALPGAWIAALGPGGRLVAPVDGELLVIDKALDGSVSRRSLGRVLYVGDRSAAAARR